MIVSLDGHTFLAGGRKQSDYQPSTETSEMRPLTINERLKLQYREHIATRSDIAK